MNLSHRGIQVLLFHEFLLGRRASKATNNICSAMDEDMLSIRTGQHWFNRFKNGNLQLDDLPHSSRSKELGVDLLKQFIEEIPRLTSLDLAEQLGWSRTAMEKHLNELGKLEIWSLDTA